MDASEFAADFVTQNIEGILKLAKKAYGSVDEVLQVKLKTAYTDYLKGAQEKYSNSKSFFIRNQSVDLYSYYVSSGIRCDRHLIQAPDFKGCIEFSKNLIITGSGGSGKSVLMRHLFLDCMRSKKYTPILVELRDLNSEGADLDSCILGVLDGFGFDTSGGYFTKAKEAGHFCFFFDGYDEVDYALRKKVVAQINELTSKYAKCPVVISSRPDDVFGGLDSFSVFSVVPLTLEVASNLIERLPYDEEVKKKFVADLKGGLFKKHESFLSNPLLLSIMLLTYGENAEIPTKLSVFYNQAYEALFQRHDANKGGYSRNRLTDLDVQDFSRVFSLFALQTYEKRIFKMSRTDCIGYIEKSKKSFQKDFKAQDYLADLLSAACLLVEDGLEIAFSHRSFQEYFVALYISMASPQIQEKLLERYFANYHSDKVVSLLMEIHPELVERVLIIPKLEAYFSELGIKKKVGISHIVKHMKRAYDFISIEKKKLSAARKDTTGGEALVSMMALRYGNYKFRGQAYYEQYAADLYERYKDGHAVGRIQNRLRFPTKGMTQKTPVLLDIVYGQGTFSIVFLQTAFDAFIKLKSKHENRIENLEGLLGI